MGKFFSSIRNSGLDEAIDIRDHIYGKMDIWIYVNVCSYYYGMSEHLSFWAALYLCSEISYCCESGKMSPSSEFKRYLVLDVWELVTVNIFR